MTLTSNLSQIESAGLVQLARIQPDIEYIFRHVLTQEAAYESLLKQDRRRLHASVGSVLEHLHRDDVQENAAVLAYHFWQGGEWLKAGEYAIHAGHAALARNALREAMGHYDRAVQAFNMLATPPLESLFDALLGWVDAAYRFRPYSEQLERLEKAQAIARSLDDRRRLARALYTIGNIYRASGRNQRAIEPLAECFVLADQLGDPQLTVIPTYYRALLVMDNEPQLGMELLTGTIEMARTFVMPDMEAYALATRSMVLARLGESQQALLDIMDALRMADQVQSPMIRSDIDLYAGWLYADLGNVPLGLQYGRSGLNKALAADNTDCVCFGFACIGFCNLQLQQFPEASTAFEETIWRSRFTGARPIEQIGLTGMAMTHLFAGAPGAFDEAEQALKEAEQIGDHFTSTMLLQALGEAYASTGDIARSLAYLNQAADFYRRTKMRPRLSQVMQSIAALTNAQGQMNGA